MVWSDGLVAAPLPGSSARRAHPEGATTAVGVHGSLGPTQRRTWVGSLSLVTVTYGHCREAGEDGLL